MKLGLDADELASCVACGLCLPHCPTYRETGEEAASPRGRIAAMRVIEAGAAADDAFVGFMEGCVQCRACESACPSGVPFGRLMEGTREAMARAHRSAPWWQRAGYRILGHHRALLALSTVGAVAQRARLVPKRLGLPRLALQRKPLRVLPAAPGTDEVWLYTGCVMDAWQRSTHQAVVDVLEAAGASVQLPRRGGDCCGALHTHAGLADAASRLAERTMRSMPGDAPILVDSAGCGAQLKDYGHLVGTPAASTFASRVLDVHEWLAPRVDRLPDQAARQGVVAVQDPCHLRHVQKSHMSVRTVLRPFFELRELDDDGLCCGAGGAYAVLQPDMAARLRTRKAEAIRRTGAAAVASANPGCAMHLSGAGLDVRHPLELVAEVLYPKERDVAR